MKRLGTIAAVLLAGSLAGCGSSGDTHSSSPSSSSLTSPPQPAACREGSLRVSDAGSGGVAAGTFAEALEFRSDRRCYLRGRPSIWLVSATGRRLAVVRAQPGHSRRAVVVGKKHPTYATLFFQNPSIRPRACQLRPAAMSVGVAGLKRRIEVKFKFPSMRFCPRTLFVSGFGSSGPIFR